MLVATLILAALAAYALAGAAFAIYFFARVLSRLDPAAAHPHWAFRLCIFPGVVALWPLLLRRTLALWSNA
ncbi:MAG: hypothetical protein JSR77_11375 [Planctomycetes bacterium]|nr:hypothetical protein [Planctomycetota bacterium]